MAWIYCIENKINDKKYIGKSIKSISKRWFQHKINLKRNTHINKHLQQSWNKYGEDFFAFWIIEECEKEKLSEREMFWIEQYKTFGYNGKYGYNLTKGGEGTCGRICSLETRKKIGEKTKGKISAKKGISLSEKTKEKMSQSHKGIRASIYTKKKLSEYHKGKSSPMLGKNHSEKTKNQMSNSHKEKTSSKKGIPLSEKEKKKLMYIKKSNSSSKFFGVSFAKNMNKWTSYITINKKNIYLGWFDSEIKAAETYDNYIKNNNLSNPLNFQD